MSNNLMQIKNCAFELKDLDTVGRRVVFAAAKFGNMDSDGDVIARGAFAKSISERGAESTSNRKIKFLRYHDFEHEIGLIKGMEETHEHLVVTADLGRSTKGNDAFLDYQDGIITEHSIGFMLVQDKINFLDSGVRELKEVNLMETSAVTFGANSETPTFSISKGNETEYLDKLNNQMNGYLSAIKNGKGTDERLEQIENNLRVCQLKYNNLIDSLKQVEPSNDTKLIEPTEAELFYLNLLK
jgi:HK97 family phage prohead protease